MKKKERCAAALLGNVQINAVDLDAMIVLGRCRPHALNPVPNDHLLRRLWGMRIKKQTHRANGLTVGKFAA